MNNLAGSAQAGAAARAESTAAPTLLAPGNDAGFSPCRTWRYWLTRELVGAMEAPVMMSIGVNPSTADERKNDPTIRRDMGFAKLHGCGHLWKLNAFAYRATDPQDMKRADDPVGPENMEWILRCAIDVAAHGGIVLLAWGVHAAYRQQHAHVLAMLRKERIPLRCLGRTLDGYPRHPLYVPYRQPLEIFE